MTNLINGYLTSAIDSLSVNSFASAESDIRHVMNITTASPELLTVAEDINNHDIKDTRKDVKNAKQLMN